jgi:hypothetical protein
MNDRLGDHLDWCVLALYAVLAVTFWSLALGPGGGGTSEVQVGWSGAVINFVLLVPIWRGRTWSIPLLAFGMFGLALAIALGGVPPDGPIFGALAALAAAMGVTLGCLGYIRRDVDHCEASQV